jgi:hypothetical protein
MKTASIKDVIKINIKTKNIMMMIYMNQMNTKRIAKCKLQIADC